ncbi:hypothetical protein Gotri_020637 [Gossypium trilobum]|uniref:Homeobox domain-containing protein n=1 Tax=Gossypium trilobum TaxID=34281 RepID=A0A7J9DA03_9ROSI|nr:hypothetical protein [Gossypium trilobum]
MEGGNMDTSGDGGTTGDSRWNPTKEQISILESLYLQGLRTPSADQIQQITSRLKAYGSIEGKNVFYWFQNHKARQRQKQKQQNLAYINRYLYWTTQPVYPPPPPHGINVACGPHFLPQVELGIYPQTQCPKVLLPGGDNRRERPAKMGKPLQRDYNTMLPDAENFEGLLNISNHETLELFPLHPTGLLETKETLMSPLGSTNSAGISIITPSISCETTAGIDQEGSGTGEQQFFDFFTCQGSSARD